MAHTLPAVAMPMHGRKGQKGPAYRNGGSTTVVEPGKFISDRTGKVIFTAGEGGKDERVKITPLEVKPGKTMKPGPGVEHYDLGADLIAKGVDPTDQTVRNAIAAGTLNYQNASQVAPQTTTQTQTQQPTAPEPTPYKTAAITGYGAAGQSQYDAANAVLAARKAALDAAAGVNAAASKSTSAAGTANTANAAYLAEQARANAAQGGYLGQQAGAVAASTAEEKKIQAAGANVADKTAVGRAQADLSVQNRIRADLGLSALTQVDLPEGQQTAAPGLVAAPRTLEQYTTEAAQNASKLRDLSLKATGVTVDQAGNKSAAAGIRANQAENTAGAANIEEQVARNKAAAAGVDVQRAQLGEDQSQVAPAAGLVFDPYTGNFVSPQELDVAQAKRGITKDQVNGDYVTKEVMDSRTDAAGNVLRVKDNVWVDPKTKNELVNGVWTDPKSGNVMTGPNTWQSPTGETFHVTDADSGSGYWEDKEGFYLQANGIWFNPVTGTRKVNGKEYQTGEGWGAAAQAEMNLDDIFTEDTSSGDTRYTAQHGGQPLFPGNPGAKAEGDTLPFGNVNPATGVPDVIPMFPENEQRNAAMIVKAESGGNPNSISAPNKDGSRDYGLFQINSGNFAALSLPVSPGTMGLGVPVNAQNILDPTLNPRGAYAIWLAAGKKWSNDWTTARDLGIR